MATDYEKIKSPVYRILDEKGFFGPNLQLWKEDEVILYKDEPNLKMKPLNEAARKVMAEYITRLEGFARKKAEKEGKEFTGLPVDMTQQLTDDIESAFDESKRIMGLDVSKKVPGRPTPKSTDPRVSAVIEVDADKKPEVMTLHLKHPSAA